jgi:hypothetical protein
MGTPFQHGHFVCSPRQSLFLEMQDWGTALAARACSLTRPKEFPRHAFHIPFFTAPAAAARARRVASDAEPRAADVEFLAAIQPAIAGKPRACMTDT